MSHVAAQSRPAWLRLPLFRWSLGIILAVVAGALVFEALNFPVLSRIGLPHEFCYLRDPRLVWLHVTADFLIGAAYVSISVTLAYLVYRASRDIPFNSVFLAFGLFIVSCGFTHFMEVWVIWHPVYWLSGYVKVVTAAASVATAIALFPLVPRIFALIAAARESEVRRVEIERLNTDLERFNYSVAHDLRAPLRSIVGFAEILREEHLAVLPPEVRTYLERMQHSAERMDALVGGLLRYATIGRQPAELKPVETIDVVHAALGLLESTIGARGAEVVVQRPLPRILGDGLFLQVVIQNLVGNALKFVASGVTPEVQIRGEVVGDDVILSVIDNGVGFPPGTAPRAFGMFERFHPDHPGTGIGLAIVHRAVERMQGEIGIEPRTDAPGTRFWVRLRRA
ncbi:ATP-binding protein [Opitutus sp. ER46]|uniref:sensor histidine kinase n=1 Tax=Opitutus sp. ER46 TaxID=2161864 RepID=UPI000D30B343|nr:ATP-binding protein [Opitutus sp. ER46]PTX90724.1 hypothetical protein DB354_18860 [Opitutus sp. ER46]